MKSQPRSETPKKPGRATVLMLLTNSYNPDPRVRQEALTLLDMAYRVRLLAWDRDCRSPLAEVMEGVEVERVRLSSSHGRGTTQLFFYLLLYLRLFWRGWRIPFQAVHCHDLDTLPIGFVLGKLKRKPIIYDAHESFLEMFEGRVHPWVLRTLYRLENFMLRRIDLLITVGEKLKRYFVDRGAAHAVVVGNWKNLKDYERTPQQNLEIRKQLGIPENALVVTSITQLLPNRMLKELAMAIAPYPDVYAVIAGMGEIDPEVRRWARENPRVIHLGFIHASAVPAYTCASDAIYCGFDPSMANFRFAAPNKLFEALAAGRPLITPGIGEIGDTVRNGNCGVVMRDCSAESVREAIGAMRDPERRVAWTRNAADLGRTEMNWRRGEEVLDREYARLLPVGRVQARRPFLQPEAPASAAPRSRAALAGKSEQS